MAEAVAVREVAVVAVEELILTRSTSRSNLSMSSTKTLTWTEKTRTTTEMTPRLLRSA
jgi:hypothetical protein